MDNPIKIIIVDDSRFFKNALKNFLNQDRRYQIIGEANNGEEFLALIKTAHPDIVLMDIKMPMMDGATATKQILKDNRFLKIIALTIHEDFYYLEQMIEAGVKGYVYKNSANKHLKIAIEQVLKGKYFYQDEN